MACKFHKDYLYHTDYQLVSNNQNTSGKRVNVKSVSGVRIPLTPQSKALKISKLAKIFDAFFLSLKHTFLPLVCTILHNFAYLCTKMFANGLQMQNKAMTTTKLYLDNRRLKDDGTAPIKITITHNRKTTHLPTGICVRPEHWDNRSLQVVGITTKHQLNRQIASIKHEVDSIIMDIKRINTMTVKAIRKHIEDTMSGTMEVGNLIAPRFESYGVTLSNRTRQIYMTTLNKLKEFDKEFAYRTFDEIGKDYLQRFDAFLATSAPSANTRSIYMRCLRSIFNDAIDNDITTNYPFRRFKIKTEATRKRSYSVDVLRKILTAECKEEWQIKYLDFFKLTFYLIGINAVDLIHLNIYKNGRIEYTRAKTHKPYSIKVEPEAEELINKYKGKKYLLNYMDSNSNYRCFYFNMTKGLKAIKQDLVADGVEIEELTTYWARHTWATIASELDIPKDTIAAALGHGGNSVTDIYINFDIKKVDEANRKVLDYVLYNKK